MSEWYFMTGGEQQGPVTAAQLKALASAGTVGPEDLVWNQTMTEWVPARRVRGLPFAAQAGGVKQSAAEKTVVIAPRAAVVAAAPEPEPESEAAPADAFESSEPVDRPVSEPSRKIENARTADDETTGESAELLGKCKSWVALMSVLFIAAIALVIAYEIWRILPETQHATSKTLLTTAKTKWGIRQIVRTLAALLMLIPWLALTRFGSALGRAKSSGSSADVNAAIKAQLSFWKAMVVTSIVVFVIAVIAFLSKSGLQK